MDTFPGGSKISDSVDSGVGVMSNSEKYTHTEMNTLVKRVEGGNYAKFYFLK